MAPELNAWTEMAARAFGLYSGINDAIKMTRAKHGPAASHASEIRQQMILMSIIRAFAVMDRNADVSFQSVYRFLKTTDALPLVAKAYADSEPKSSIHGATQTCGQAIERFLQSYRSIDFSTFGRLQAFRNTGIAHITWPDVRRARVTYSNVESLVRNCCEMAGQLSLMVSGRNDWPVEHLDDAHSTSYKFWLSLINAEADGLIDL